MARLKALTDNITGEKYYVQPSTGSQFQRTSGSIVWTFKNVPGCVIVLGESRGKPNFLAQRRHDVFRLAEFESSDDAELMHWLQVWTSDYYVHNWATPTSDHRVWMIEDANAELRSLRRPRIRFADPLGWAGKGEGMIPFYSGLVGRRTRGEKTLHLGSPCEAAEQMRSLPEDAQNKPPTEFPSAAALWFAVAEIDLDPREDCKLDDAVKIGAADTVGGY